MIDVTKFDGHTPGPWKITHGGFSTDDGFSIGSNNAAALRVKVVCECWPCTIVDQQHREELLVNANLLAAAPELLAEVLRLRSRVKELEADAAKYRALMESLGNMPTEHPPIWDSRNVSQ